MKMNFNDFSSIRPFRKQQAMFMAMVVRNSMEQFHIDNLSDAQMKELNPIIRQAIYDGLVQYERMVKIALGENVKDKEKIESEAKWTIMMIPDYWELPK